MTVRSLKTTLILDIRYEYEIDEEELRNSVKKKVFEMQKYFDE
jgi:uncharacterized membrane protein (DUF106 family)